MEAVMRSRFSSTGFLLALMLLLVPHSALAECTTYTEVAWQWTLWQDGSMTYLFLGMTQYTVCDVGGSGGGPGPGPGGGSGGGPASYPPSVSIVHVDTTDPVNPLVVADIASNDPNDPVNVVNLEVNGATVDYAYWSNTGFARYQLRLAAISSFSEGNVGITAKACSATGVCAQSSTTMNRFTPSPGAAGSTIFASWLEEDEGDEESGPGFVLRSGSYSHGLRQLYTRTSFTCSEVGENSHYQVKDSLVTLSSRDPMPEWAAMADAYGTLGFWTSYSLTEAANPVACTFPVHCSSKGGSLGAFGYAPSIQERITSFSIEAQPTYFTNGSISFPLP